MNLKGINILVTGGCGFIGGHLVKQLNLQKANVTVLDINLDPRSTFALDNLKQSVKLKFIDIRDREMVFSAFRRSKPEFVFHLAAEAIVERSYQDPFTTFGTNVMGTINILDAARQFNVKGVIVASSDKAYGKSRKAYKEDMPLQGDHPYDVSKSCEDLIAQTYYKTYGLPVAITRFGNIYGEGDLNFSRIIPDICMAVSENKTLNLRSNGKYIRDYVYVKDVVNSYIFLLKKIAKIKGEAFNFSSKDNLSVIELINLAEKILKAKIDYKILNTARNEIPYQHLNDKKIRELGWQSKYNLKGTFPGILAWYKGISN